MKSIKPEFSGVKIAVTYLAPDMVHALFCQSLASMAMYSIAQGIGMGVNISQSSVVDIGRGVQVHECLRHAPTHLLFLDSDMRFPSDTLARLLRRDKDIVGCTYSQRRSPRGYTHRSVGNDFAVPSNDVEIFPVNSLGLGCVLIRANVFRRMTRPWFKTIIEVDKPTNKDGSDAYTSEDIYFFNAARANGYEVWCDWQLSQQIGHVGMFAFELKHVEMYDASKWS